MLTNAVEPHAIDVISEAWFYVATHFLTEIWDRRCWHQKAGICFLIFSQKMGINILGGPLRTSFRFQETVSRKTAENTAKLRGGSVGSVVANHRGGGESSMVVTTL